MLCCFWFDVLILALSLLLLLLFVVEFYEIIISNIHIIANRNKRSMKHNAISRKILHLRDTDTPHHPYRLTRTY